MQYVIVALVTETLPRGSIGAHQLHAAAVSYYHVAANRTTSIPERNYLNSQAARLSRAGQLGLD